MKVELSWDVFTDATDALSAARIPFALSRARMSYGVIHVPPERYRAARVVALDVMSKAGFDLTSALAALARPSHPPGSVSERAAREGRAHSRVKQPRVGLYGINKARTIAFRGDQLRKWRQRVLKEMEADPTVGSPSVTTEPDEDRWRPPRAQVRFLIRRGGLVDITIAGAGKTTGSWTLSASGSLVLEFEASPWSHERGDEPVRLALESLGKDTWLFQGFAYVRIR